MTCTGVVKTSPTPTGPVVLMTMVGQSDRAHRQVQRIGGGAGIGDGQGVGHHGSRQPHLLRLGRSDEHAVHISNRLEHRLFEARKVMLGDDRNDRFVNRAADHIGGNVHSYGEPGLLPHLQRANF